MTPDAREPKLPSWVQRILSTLRSEINALRVEVGQLKGEPGRSRTAAVVTYGNKGSVTVPLHDDQVEFTLAGERRIRVYVQDNRLHVNAYDGLILIEPQAANCFNVRVRLR